MSLLTPSPGEIYDRLGIIAMKLATGNRAEHLVEERKRLFDRLWERTQARAGLLSIGLDPPLTAERWRKEAFACAVLVDELFAVNAFIWHKEDEIRELIRARRHPDPMNDDAEAGLLAKEIRKLADRRHQLIAEIDRIYGEPRAGKEKSWMKEKPGVVPAAAQVGFEGFGSILTQVLRCPHCQGMVNMP